MLLKDKVALITGAASGIGKEIAIEYAKAGTKVVIADLALEAARAAADDINKSGGTAMAVAMNVTDEAQVDQGIADAVAAYGSLDILISKGGKGGSIIYMGSVHSHEASPLKAPYVTAKHGLIGLAKVVAKEGAKDKIRSNVICPGFVRTPLVEKQIPEQAKELNISEEDVIKKVMLKDTVDGEFTTTADVAQTAVFLAAFPTNALTGQSVVVSHGWFMQ